MASHSKTEGPIRRSTHFERAPAVPAASPIYGIGTHHIQLQAKKEAEAQNTQATTTRRIGPVREAINRLENLRGMALGMTGLMEIEFDRVFGAVPEDPQPEADNSDLPDPEMAQLHVHITSLENAMRRLYQQAQRAQEL